MAAIRPPDASALRTPEGVAPLGRRDTAPLGLEGTGEGGAFAWCKFVHDPAKSGFARSGWPRVRTAGARHRHEAGQEHEFDYKA
jgi:hypothetical protein